MATVNFIKNAGQSGAAMRRTIRYVERSDKTRDRAFVSGQNCTPQLAEREFLATRQAHRKDGGRWFYHYTQSFSPQENVTPEQAHKVAKEFAARAWSESEVVVATHVDAAHIHSHFIVNAVCFETGTMLRQHPDTLQKLRAISDELCMAHGLSVLPKKQKRSDKVSAREYRSAAKGQSWKFRLMATVDECMRYAGTREEFIALMRGEGYEVKWSGTRKYITYTTPDGDRCRDNKLHSKKYSKEAMEYEFRIRQGIIDAGIARPKQEADQQSAADAPTADAHHGGVSGLAGAARSDGQDTRRAPQDERAAVQAADEGGRGGDAENAGADARSGAASGETGWEKEREAFRAYLAGGQGLAGGSSPDAVVDVAGGDPAGRSGVSGVVLREPSAGRNIADASVSAVIRLGCEVEAAANMPLAYDATMRPEHIDSKRRRALQEKRIALGHKPDDHEEPSNNHHQQQI